MHYVGIDIAKRSHVAAVQDQEGEVIAPPFKFANSQSVFDEFLQVLKKVGASPDSCRIDMEATGQLDLPFRLPDFQRLQLLRDQSDPDRRLQEG